AGGRREAAATFDARTIVQTPPGGLFFTRPFAGAGGCRIVPSLFPVRVLVPRSATNGGHPSPGPAAVVRRDHPPRPVVGPAPAGLRRALRVHRVRHLGRVPGAALHLRTVTVAVLLAGAVRQHRARMVRPAAVVVAGLAAVLAGAVDPVGAG